MHPVGRTCLEGTMFVRTRSFIGLFTAVLFGWTVLYAGQAAATGLFYYAHEDGSVSGVPIGAGPADQPIPEAVFFGTTPTPATSRNIAFDPDTNLLWYAASDNHVHTVDVDTFVPGPIINDMGDAFFGAMRTLAIDALGRRLYIATSLGDVRVYELVSNTFMYTIPLASWGVSEPNPGNLRHLAADADGLLWYAAADGSFKQFNPAQASMSYTGRVVLFADQVEPVNPGQFRYFAIHRWPAGEFFHYLYYAVSDGSIRAVTLQDLEDAGVAWPAVWFGGATNPGALRSFTIDPAWEPTLDPDPRPPTDVNASKGTYADKVRVTWDFDPLAEYYTLYRWGNLGFGDTWLQWDTGPIALEPGTGRPYSDDLFADPGIQYEYTASVATATGFFIWSAEQDTGWVFAPTPSCSDGVVVVDFDFLTGGPYQCVAGTSISTSGPVTVGSGITVTFSSPSTTLDNLFSVQSGGIFSINSN